MPHFSKSSRSKLDTCHPDLIKVMEEVIKHYDFTVLEGARTLKRQKELVATGMSKTLNSKHIPGSDGLSRAIDIAPYPIDWSTDPKKVARFYFMGGMVIAIASSMGIKLRWGFDWDGDHNFDDQTFFDGPHFELKA